MKPNDGKLRRDRQGQATAFKTPEPVLFLIEMIEGGQNVNATVDSPLALTSQPEVWLDNQPSRQ